MSTDSNESVTSASSTEEVGASSGAPASPAPAAETGSSTYDLLLARLAEVAEKLAGAANALNVERASAFETVALELCEQERFHSNGPAVPRDAVAVNDLLLVGLNAGPGLRKGFSIDEMLVLFQVERKSARDWELTPIAPTDPRSFLQDPSFRRDLGELITYYADFRLNSLTIHNGQLLMVFGVGSDEADTRVLRWRLGPDAPMYVDAYGDHDVVTPQRFGFDWTDVDRNLMSEGRWPHFNIADTLFVGIGRHGLEFRIDDAVEGGRTVHTESLVEMGQDVGELRVAQATLGDVLLVRILPYRETIERFYVFNRLTRVVHRADAIGLNCHRLPDDQGVVFPGGFHLANGDTKLFATDAAGFELYSIHRSPNGEDLLYSFYRPSDGGYLILPYNLVRRSMATPVACHGYAVFDDGTVAMMRADVEPQRVHTLAVYTSPFCVPERYKPSVGGDTFLGRVGNPELVRGLGETLSLARDARDVEFNAAVFEALVARAGRLLDTHAWLDAPEAHGMGPSLTELRRSAGAVLDEFAAVAQAKTAAVQAVVDAERRTSDYIVTADLPVRDAEAYVELLAQGRTQLGLLVQLSERHYVDKAQVAALTEKVTTTHEALGSRALTFLAEPAALDGLATTLDATARRGTEASKAADVEVLIEEVSGIGDRVVLLTDIVGSLDVSDPTVRTQVLTLLADLLARRNTVRNTLDLRLSELRTAESSAEFQAAVAVLAQRATANLQAASTPSACDQALAALGAELENLEMRFGQVEAFTDVLATRRDEMTEAFGQRRDAIARERTDRVDRLVASTERLIETATERAGALGNRADVEGFFAADQLVTRARRSIKEIAELGDAGRAGELTAGLSAAHDRALRTVSDKAELFDPEGRVRIGRWSFGVNVEPFELRLASVPQESRRNGASSLSLRLTGTELVVPLAADQLPAGTAGLIEQVYPSETATLSRAVYLAFSALSADRADDVRVFAGEHLDDGYELGVHDADALRIIEALHIWWPIGALRTSGAERAIAAVWLAAADPSVASEVTALRALGAAGKSQASFVRRHQATLASLADDAGLDIDVELACEWLVAHGDKAVISPAARGLAEETVKWATTSSLDLKSASFANLVLWTSDRAPQLGQDLWAEAAWAIHDPRVPNAIGVVGDIDEIEIDGLVSRHGTIVGGRLRLQPAAVWREFLRYRRDVLPRFRELSSTRRGLLDQWRNDLGLASLRPRVMSSFVRNRLIDEVYLPLIGDNLARQLGMNGANQGLLLLISPPGYGKTSLVEYVCDLLGLAMVKVSGPALGHGVTNLDPATAPDAASRAELVKLNRGLAMASNVVVYVDDIQHTSPEFLQKFIPLTDATRRIDGVLDGEPRSYDLTGRRMAVVMAGNPYSSAGTNFRIPDMLANRADVYNLGDVASQAGAAAFGQSYVEIGCGVNPVLSPILGRSKSDLGRLLRAAAGEPLRSDQLSHAYGANELGDIVRALGHLSLIRDVMLKVNAEYMRSASLDDAMRGEPPFLLQGSYRNMTRISAKVIPAMTAEEVDRLVRDHYRAEAQTLAAASQWNLAKLAVILGDSDPEAEARVAELRARWAEARVGDDPLIAVAASLRGIEAAMNGAGTALRRRRGFVPDV